MDILKKNARIRAVIAACKARGIDADTRHALQVQITGKASLKDMNVFDLDSVLNRLNARAAGKKPANEWAFVFRLVAERRDLCKKIYKLAERIGAGQKPPAGPMGKHYIEGIAERALGADTVLEFCSPEILRNVIIALEIHCKRKGF